MKEITLKQLNCIKCKWVWIPRDQSKKPSQCPRCKTYYWEKPKG